MAPDAAVNTDNSAMEWGRAIVHGLTPIPTQSKKRTNGPAELSSPRSSVAIGDEFAFHPAMARRAGRGAPGIRGLASGRSESSSVAKSSGRRDKCNSSTSQKR